MHRGQTRLRPATCVAGQCAGSRLCLGAGVHSGSRTSRTPYRDHNQVGELRLVKKLHGQGIAKSAQHAIEMVLWQLVRH
eukprot:8301530-Alexandrium_andersonii.AAC.1